MVGSATYSSSWLYANSSRKVSFIECHEMTLVIPKQSWNFSIWHAHLN